MVVVATDVNVDTMTVPMDTGRTRTFPGFAALLLLAMCAHAGASEGDGTPEAVVASFHKNATSVTAIAGEVNVVVGSSFESEVINADKDVFIMFYAPWSGHCKALTPKMIDLAKELQGEFDSLLIAKFDHTANDIPDEYRSAFPVPGFPTLYFAPKGRKAKPVLFDGDRSVEGMKTWLNEKRSA